MSAHADPVSAFQNSFLLSVGVPAGIVLLVAGVMLFAASVVWKRKVFFRVLTIDGLLLTGVSVALLVSLLVAEGLLFRFTAMAGGGGLMMGLFFAVCGVMLEREEGER